MKCKKCKADIPDGSRFCNMCGARVAAGRKPKSRGNGTGSVYKRGCKFSNFSGQNMPVNAKKTRKFTLSSLLRLVEISGIEPLTS